jgi:hypothetical protein
MRKSIKKNRLFLLIATIAFIISCGTNAEITTEKSGLKNGKILEWGWETPLPSYINEHVIEMEQIPFDGLVLDLKRNDKAGSLYQQDYNRFAWAVWGSKTINPENYSIDIKALKKTNFKNFTDNFLRFNVTPGDIDWYDNDFQAVISNAALASEIAKSAGLKGILFDPEQYISKPFHYVTQKYNEQYSFKQYQQQVRKRGREFIQAINQIYPDITIILTYGYILGDAKFVKGYELYPSFLDGMLEAANPKTLIFDGWETSYGYKKEEQFKDAYKHIYKQLINISSAKDKFIQHYRASFGLWVDYGSNDKYLWHEDDLSKNYFTPDNFESSLHSALKYTDRYVWIYSERVNWWNGTMPQPYIEALKKAKEQ